MNVGELKTETRYSDFGLAENSAPMRFDQGRWRRMSHRLAAFAALPAVKLFGNRNEEAFGILMYHRIARCERNVPAPTWNVTPDNFRRQMQGLLDCGYRPWPLGQTLKWHRRGETLPPKTFIVTFDDGYENFYTAARPILKELGIPATVFLVTGFFGRARPLPFEDWPAAGSDSVPPSAWRPLTRRQCDEMLTEGSVEIGCHTHAHEDYRGRADDFYRDLETSLSSLRKWFGIENPPFAYPYGFADEGMDSIVRSCGVQCALTTIKRPVEPADDVFRWGRFPAENDDSANLLSAKMSGWYSLLLQSYRRISWAWGEGKRENHGE
jgi:peptidoglycan/xylan/chitin deacetylase (PgdA/CDA1 family)